MSKTNTKANINANIKTNGNQAITGAILNSALIAMVDDYAEQEKLTNLESEVSALPCKEVMADTYIHAIVDSEKKVLEGYKADGTKVHYSDVEFNSVAKMNDGANVGGAYCKEINSVDYVSAITDNSDKLVYGIKKDGSVYIPKLESPTLEALCPIYWNPLYGKKWVAFGDSFTYGSRSATFTDGKYSGENKVYPYYIGNRTGIEVLSDFFYSGRTIGQPTDVAFTNSICSSGQSWYYQNIPIDTDYITIYLGINDSHHNVKIVNSLPVESERVKYCTYYIPTATTGRYDRYYVDGSGVTTQTGTSVAINSDGEQFNGFIPLGTINDNTTESYYGAFNVVLAWILENRPKAHIGIIVSNGCDHIEYRSAQIEIAKKWGIPYIDLNGDARTPFMIRSLNPDISNTAKNIRLKAQAVDWDGSRYGSINTHPNDDAHEYESHIIENFLLSI